VRALCAGLALERPWLTRAKCSTFTTTLEIPEDAKAALMAMSPASYVGNAAAQARAVTGHIAALRK
jgi:hypothetical protein